MKFFEVAPNRIVRSEHDVFTYSSELDITPGHTVSVPIGKSVANGVVMREVKKPPYATKDILSVIEERPLPEHTLHIAKWIAEYYQTPLATVLQTILPRGLTTKRREPKNTLSTPVRDRVQIVLNDDQKQAVDAIVKSPGTSILQGVTGSGKTEVYKEVARQTIKAGRSAIILVPEIGLTQQIIDEFSADFPDAIVTHSQMTEAQRHIAWRKALNATEPVVVIGPRSALFMPVEHIGAIIVDEAHEPSYKQEKSPRYSALRVASVLGSFCDAKVVFGSATPLVADRFTAEANSAPVIRLDKRARSDVETSAVSLVDMTKKDNLSNHRFFSKKLIREIEHSLSLKEQSLIFHNRRGSASTTLCESCGWTAICDRCFVPYVLHEDTFSLTCHICTASRKAPTSCPDCGSADIIHKGIGTKRIETELQRIFPRAKIARFDSDNRQGETLSARYSELYSGEVDIIIGTQVVAKGLDLPHLRTVGVMQADGGLSLPDFASSERTFQLLSQVVGRVGRDSRETSVVIQTFQPTHPIIQFGVKQDYEQFYDYITKERRRAKFPPYRYLLQLTTVYKTEAGAVKASRELARELRSKLPSSVDTLGPTPAFYERQRDTFRWQLILKSKKRQDLLEAVKHVPKNNWQSELDPTSLL